MSPGNAQNKGRNLRRHTTNSHNGEHVLRHTAFETTAKSSPRSSAGDSRAQKKKETLNYNYVIAKDAREKIEDLPTITKKREAWRRAVNSIWAAADD